jgi:hypothetical protein
MHTQQYLLPAKSRKCMATVSNKALTSTAGRAQGTMLESDAMNDTTTCTHTKAVPQKHVCALSAAPMATFAQHTGTDGRPRLPRTCTCSSRALAATPVCHMCSRRYKCTCAASAHTPGRGGHRKRTQSGGAAQEARLLTGSTGVVQPQAAASPRTGTRLHRARKASQSHGWLPIGVPDTCTPWSLLGTCSTDRFLPRHLAQLAHRTPLDSTNARQLGPVLALREKTILRQLLLQATRRAQARIPPGIPPLACTWPCTMAKSPQVPGTRRPCPGCSRSSSLLLPWQHHQARAPGAAYRGSPAHSHQRASTKGQQEQGLLRQHWSQRTAGGCTASPWRVSWRETAQKLLAGNGESPGARGQRASPLGSICFKRGALGGTLEPESTPSGHAPEALTKYALASEVAPKERA